MRQKKYKKNGISTEKKKKNERTKTKKFKSTTSYKSVSKQQSERVCVCVCVLAARATVCMCVCVWQSFFYHFTLAVTLYFCLERALACSLPIAPTLFARPLPLSHLLVRCDSIALQADKTQRTHTQRVYIMYILFKCFSFRLFANEFFSLLLSTQDFHVCWQPPRPPLVLPIISLFTARQTLPNIWRVSILLLSHALNILLGICVCVCVCVYVSCIMS